MPRRVQRLPKLALSYFWVARRFAAVGRNPADAAADRAGIGLDRVPREPVLGPAVEAADELVPFGGRFLFHTRPDAAAAANLRSFSRAAGPAASPRRLGRSGRSARPRSRTPARRAGAARAQASGACRRGRPRSRAGTPRSGARRRRSAGSGRSRSRPGGRPRRRRRCQRLEPGAGVGRRFAVGKPSVPPRESPATTEPASSAGRPRRFAARSTSPARAVADPCEETPSTSGTGRASKPRLSQQREIARAAAAEAEARAGRDDLGAERPQHALGELLRRRSCASSGVELDDERLLNPGLGEELEPPLQRHQRLHAVPERLPRMGVERDHRRRQPRGERSTSTRGARGEHRRRCRARRRAARRLAARAT